MKSSAKQFDAVSVNIDKIKWNGKNSRKVKSIMKECCRFYRNSTNYAKTMLYYQ